MKTSAVAICDSSGQVSGFAGSVGFLPSFRSGVSPGLYSEGSNSVPRPNWAFEHAFRPSAAAGETVRPTGRSVFSSLIVGVARSVELSALGYLQRELDAGRLVGFFAFRFARLEVEGWFSPGGLAEVKFLAFGVEDRKRGLRPCRHQFPGFDPGVGEQCDHRLFWGALRWIGEEWRRACFRALAGDFACRQLPFGFRTVTAERDRGGSNRPEVFRADRQAIVAIRANFCVDDERQLRRVLNEAERCRVARGRHHVVDETLFLLINARLAAVRNLTARVVEAYVPDGRLRAFPHRLTEQSNRARRGTRPEALRLPISPGGSSSSISLGPTPNSDAPPPAPTSWPA